MKQLLLLRHAKSSHAQAGLDDHDRPLNRRGEEEAPLVGRYLVENDLQPQLTISSTACRAQRTTALVLAACGLKSPLLDRRLYLAAPLDIAEIAMEAPEEIDRLLLVGHNPGMESLASHLAGDAIDMRTAHLAVFQFEGIAWSDERWLKEAKYVVDWRARDDAER